MTTLREKIERDPVSYLVISVIAAVFITAIVVSLGWSLIGQFGAESESNSLSVQLDLERERFSQCQANLDNLYSKEIKCASDLKVQMAKRGAEKEVCNNRVLEHKIKLKASDDKCERLKESMSSANSSLEKQIAKLEQEKSGLESEKATLESERARLSEEVDSYVEKYNASHEIKNIDEQYNQVIEKLDITFSEHKENQELIGVYTTECNSTPSINYLASCQKLEEAVQKKESFELQIAGYQKQLDNYQERLLILNKKITDI